MSSKPKMGIGSSILIVDKDAGTTMTDLLERDGYQVVIVKTGNEAITKVKQRQYDIALLDVRMPDKEDLSLVSALKQSNPQCPIVLLSSKPQLENIGEFLSCGIVDCLRKPYTEIEFKATLNRALEIRSLRRVAENSASGLIANGERYRAIVEAATDAIILGDEHGTILSWNQAAQSMFGYAAEEIVGKSLTLIMPTRYHEAAQHGLERVRSTGEERIIGTKVELHGLRKDGEEFPIELSLSRSVRSSEVFYCGIIRDLSGCQKADKALRESEERFQLTIDHINDAVLYGDLSGRVLWTNQQGAILLGRQLDEIIGRPLMECLSPKAAALAASRLALVREGRTVPPLVEFEVIRPDGTVGWVEANVSNVIRDNKVAGRLLVGRDITDRKQSELSLVERNRILALDAEVGQILNRSQDLRVLLQACTEALVQHLEAAFARIWTLNSTEQVLELQASAGLYTHLNGSHSRVPVGHLKIGQIAAEKSPHLTNAVIGDPRVPEQEWAKREGLVAFAGYPLLREQEVVGVMALFSKHPLTEFTLNSLGMVADRITTAIERQFATNAQQKLAGLNERILASAGEGIYGLDLEGKATFVNPAGAQILGYAVEELIGVSMHATMHHTRPDGSSYPRKACPMYAAFGDGIVHHVDDEVFWRKDGTSFPVEYTCTPIWEDGRLVGAVVTFQDITERKLAQEAHQKVCEQMENTLASLPGSIFVVEQGHRVVYANAEACQHFGQKGSKLIGNLIHEVLPISPAQWNSLVEISTLESPKAAKRHYQDLEFVNQDRTYCYSLFSILFDGSKTTQTGLAVWDISEQKKLQDQLIQSEKLSSLGTLVSGMVHEVRSPMQAILGMADLIFEEDKPETIKELATDIKRISGHITTVLSDFMIYARPSSHEQAINLNLNQRCIEALKMIQRSPHFGSVEVQQQFNPVPSISIRQGEMDQVLINLISNAVQAMGGKGQLTLTTQHTDNLVIAQISDTGCGIPKEALSKIFDPFFSTKGKGKGTGLGLSIVQQIVMRNGGQITVDSTEGKGTTFTLKFPVNTATY